MSEIFSIIQISSLIPGLLNAFPLSSNGASAVTASCVHYSFGNKMEALLPPNETKCRSFVLILLYSDFPLAKQPSAPVKKGKRDNFGIIFNTCITPLKRML